jgi:hypothetical protein
MIKDSMLREVKAMAARVAKVAQQSVGPASIGVNRKKTHEFLITVTYELRPKSFTESKSR